MYTEHPAFKLKHPDNAKIWRYIDFTKFYSLLEKNALHFARSDLLSDKFEGSLSSAPQQVKMEPLPPDVYRSHLGVDYESYLKLDHRTAECLRRSVYICSFHLNEYESAAMWKLFLNSNEGIAIQSTCKKLKDCFSVDDKYSVRIGEVEYTDYNKDPIDISNGFKRYLHKRKSFEYEKELRAIVWDRDQLGKSLEGLNVASNKGEIPSIYPFSEGLFVPVDIVTLIEKVFIAPTAPDWFADIVKSASGLFGYNFEIVRSSLDDDPVY